MKGVTFTYDDQCWSEYISMYSRVRHLFMSIDIQCPYGLPHVATFHQASFAPLSERAMELFLAAGYRRNGNSLYNMKCRQCSACIPIRLHCAEFQPSRNQRRALKKNKDIETSILPLRPSHEDLELCEKFLRTRYPRENNTARGYYRDFFLNSIVNSGALQYRVNGRLVGTSIIDIGYNWLNAVYFFFDPGESRRSLGTYNILQLIQLCREWEIEYLYLGYVIKSVSAMSYKCNFRPYHTFGQSRWHRGK